MEKLETLYRESELPQVYDVEGSPRDWDWLQSKYGAVVYAKATETGPDGLVFRLTAVHETYGDAGVVMRVYDARGEGLRPLAPMVGTLTGLYWPDPEEPISTEGALSRWAEYVGAKEKTNEEGHAGYGLGGGSYYYPPEVGPHWSWILSPSATSDALAQFGMLSGTNHHGILSMNFWLFQEEEPIPPEPPEPPEGKRLFILEVDGFLKVEAVGYKATLQALELETDLSGLGLSLESDARYPFVEKKLEPMPWTRWLDPQNTEED